MSQDTRQSNRSKRTARVVEETSSEPRAANRSLPPLLFGVLAALLYWGDVYIMDNGGDLMGKGGSFPEEVYYPIPSYVALQSLHPKDTTDWRAIGGVVYQRNCQPCHQLSGLGQPGMFPPLAGSDWVMAEGPNRIIRIVLDGLNGPITVSGQQFNSSMVPWRDTIPDDNEMAAVISFIRNEWGNTGSIVTPEKVKEVREATKDRAGRPWTADELLQVPAAD